MIDGILVTVVAAILFAALTFGWRLALARSDQKRVHRWLLENTRDEPGESHVEVSTLAAGVRLPEERLIRACIASKPILRSTRDPNLWSIWRAEPQSIYVKTPGPLFGSTQEVTKDDLELLFARTFGVPDDYDFGSRPLSVAVERLQRDMDKRLAEYAQPKIKDHLRSFEKEKADSPRSKEDEELDELIRMAEKEGWSHDIRIGSDINVGGSWRTQPGHVGSGNLTTYQVLQGQDGVRLTQDHPQIGRTVSGRGVITGMTVHVWYRTITGATGKLELEIPSSMVIGEDFHLEGRWDSGHGRRGDVILTRK